jgi:hypothetical protein
MVSVAGKKDGGRQVISQVAKVAAFILAQFAQQLAQLAPSSCSRVAELWRGNFRRLLVLTDFSEIN